MSESFVTESNRIEGIDSPPTKAELKEHDRFVNLQRVTLNDLKQFVSIYQPRAVIRDSVGMDVWVGGRMPPLGGPNIPKLTEELLSTVDLKTPFELHNEYEMLHPFIDGNGRSGRALWAWKMLRTVGNHDLGFLHTYYYQSLEAWGEGLR